MTSTSPDGETAALARFVAELRFDRLPAAVVSQACDVTLDALGCAIAAWRDDAEKAAIMTRIAESFRAQPIATIWGSSGRRTDAAIAALVNGALTNAADFDDTHKRALLHTGSVVVPPALAPRSPMSKYATALKKYWVMAVSAPACALRTKLVKSWSGEGACGWVSG